MNRAGVTKRVAQVPRPYRGMLHDLSKADLMEIAWSLGSLCNGGNSLDDDAATFERLEKEANTQRLNQGRGLWVAPRGRFTP